VDIVVNKWLAGEQQPVARVFVRDGGLAVETPDPARWTSIVDRVLADLSEGEPQARLQELPTALHGSHLFATAPHGNSDCPFHGWDAIGAESVELRQL